MTAPKNAPVWSGPRLIVPIAVDCLLVGKPDVQGSEWARTGINYQRLSQGLGGSTPTPFLPVAEADKPAVGAHLSWTLPFALRRGAAPTEVAPNDGTVSTQSTDTPDSGDRAGNLQFPLIPNRWLVLRAQYDAQGSAPELVATVISSDHLEDASSHTIPLTVSQYPLPGAPGKTGILGKSEALANWAGTLGAYAPYLRATAPGDVTWIAAYDNVRNVVSIHDPLADPAALYGYSVIGWYSDPASDPLYNINTATESEWRTALEQTYQWSLGNAASDVRTAVADWLAWAKSRGVDTGAPEPGLPKQLEDAIERWDRWREANGEKSAEPDLPRQTLMSGALFNVDWQGSDYSYGSGAPGGGKDLPSLAVGNTAPQAIAAWLATKLVEHDQSDPETIPRLERAIEAFQAGLLNDLEHKPGITEAALHAKEFVAQGQHNRFVVVRPEIGDGATTEGGDPSVPLDQNQTDLLTKLNVIQAEIDSLTNTLHDQQAELFALAWKRTFLPRGQSALETKINTAWDVMSAAIAATSQAITERTTDTTGTRAVALAALKASLVNKDGKTVFEVRFVTSGAAHRPNDPVLLIAGSKGDPKYAAPGTYDGDDKLICRVTGQSVTGLDLAGLVAGAQSLDAGKLLGAVTLPTSDAIPKELPDLWVEFLFSDTGAAPFLAKQSLIAGGVSPTDAQIDALAAKIRAIQEAPWRMHVDPQADPHAVAAAVGFVGTLAHPPAVTFRTGQPWSPVYVDWRLSWSPDGSSFDDMLANWDLGSDDFIWTGGQVQPANPPIEFVARTVFDATVAQGIATQLQKFQDNPDYAGLPHDTRQALENMAGLIANADLYTVSAASVTERLLTRMIAPNQDTFEPQMAALVGDAPVTFQPRPGDVAGNGEPFFPLRSGHFQLLDVWVVDSWGQILIGKPPQVADNLPIPGVIRAQSVTTPKFEKGGQDLNASFIQMTPRINDATRIDLDLLDACHDTILSNSSDMTSPVCGFVVPNNLDVSLAVFDQAGGSDGAVLKVQTEQTLTEPSKTGLRWDAPPGSSAPLGAPPDLRNLHMQGLVQGLLGRGRLDGGRALDTLFDHIDSALWPLSPLGLPARGAGTLLGQPLAVVRAQISARIIGQAAYDQKWDLTGAYYVADEGGKPVYKPQPVPVMSVSLPARIGDAGLSNNGVMGYFVDDDYDTFYAVYGANQNTAALRRSFSQPPDQRAPASSLLGQTVQDDGDTGFVKTDHLVDLKLDGTPVKLTILLDPRGRIPVTSGWQPTLDEGLAPGPVSRALAAMQASFRVGPLLTDPHDIRMPLPSEVRGNWGWAIRSDVTGWAPEEKVTKSTSEAKLYDVPLHLSEGWLTLSGAFGGKE